MELILKEVTPASYLSIEENPRCSKKSKMNKNHCMGYNIVDAEEDSDP